MSQRTLVVGSSARQITRLDLLYVARVLEFKAVVPAEHEVDETVEGRVVHRWSVLQPPFELLLVRNTALDATYVEIRGSVATAVDGVAAELAPLLGAVPAETLIATACATWRIDPAALVRAALAAPESHQRYEDAIVSALAASEDAVLRSGLFAATLLPRDVGEALLTQALAAQRDAARASQLTAVLGAEGWGLTDR